VKLPDRIARDIQREQEAAAEDLARVEAEAERERAEVARARRLESAASVLRAVFRRGWFWPPED
jgi:hypothetical protein